MCSVIQRVSVFIPDISFGNINGMVCLKKLFFFLREAVNFYVPFRGKANFPSLTSKHNSSNIIKISYIAPPSKCKIQNQSQIINFFSLVTQFLLFPITSLFSISNSMTYHQPTKKKSGVFLETFRTINFILHPAIYVMSLTVPIPTYATSMSL